MADLDPLSVCEKAVLDCLRARPGLVDLVKPANWVDMTGDSRDKPFSLTGDHPKLMLLAMGLADIRTPSGALQAAQQYDIIVRTGTPSGRVMNRITWELLMACHKAIRQLTSKFTQHVVNARLTGIDQQLTTASTDQLGNLQANGWLISAHMRVELIVPDEEAGLE